MDRLLHDRIPCLDHGFVQLIDHMGDDSAIVDAARTSISGEKVKATSEDRGLIRYLLRNRHTTPFEMVVFKFLCKMPIFVARQWVRHRMASINEMSGRYGVLPEEFYVPALEDIQFQAKTNKQGRSEVIPEPVAEKVQTAMRQDSERSFRRYKQFLAQDDPDQAMFGGGLGLVEVAELNQGGGVARELARINLPLSTYTQWVWKIDLHNLLHFLGLRLDKHAQKEIRVFGEAIASIVKEVVPITWEAFEDYRLNSVTFSGPEMALLKKLFSSPEMRKVMEEEHVRTISPGLLDLPTKREQTEFLDKLHSMLGMR